MSCSGQNWPCSSAQAAATDAFSVFGCALRIGKSMNRNRIFPVLTSCARTSGSVSSAKRLQAGHSKSPNSITSRGAVGLPITYP